jgi:Spx/MgsR family transcriptional regulator
MLTLFGIGSCDSCRKARKWLDTNGVEHRFHDLRADGLDRSMLERWAATVGWRSLLNTRSTTWRGLTEADKQDIDDQKAFDLMLRHPTLVKRPITESGSDVIVGFNPDRLRNISG